MYLWSINLNLSKQISPERVQELKDVLGKLKQNKDIDNIKHLMEKYENSTLEEKLIVLEDLDYYMHQIDNGGFHLNLFEFIFPIHLLFNQVSLH